MQPTLPLLALADAMEKRATQEKINTLLELVNNAVRTQTHNVTPIKKLMKTITRRSEDQAEHINEMLVNARGATSYNTLVKRMFQAHKALENRNLAVAKILAQGSENPTLYQKVPPLFPSFS